jgi:hypothetical protein
MKIGFDLDGVLRQSRVGGLNMATQLKKNQNGTFDMDEWIALETATIFPLLNPWLFAQKDDKVYVVTAVLRDKGESLRKVIGRKKSWVRHFIGPRAKVITVMGNWKNGKDYVEPVVKAKVKVMRKLGIEVYFDDDPAIVRRMREIIKRRHWGIKVLHYGPWLEEYY